jgi:hypothetical protein
MMAQRSDPMAAPNPFEDDIARARQWVQRVEGWQALDYIQALIHLLDGYATLQDIHRRAVIQDKGKSYEYCTACAKPWPCDTNTALLATIRSLTAHAPATHPPLTILDVIRCARGIPRDQPVWVPVSDSDSGPG